MNVLLIDIDSLRPDHIGIYDYKQDTTPNIDRLASDSAVFKNAYAASSPSLPSRASMISGRYSVSNGIVSHGRNAQKINSPKTMDPEKLKNWDGDMKDWWLLPELFFENRIETIGISSEPRHPVTWINNTFHKFYQPQEPEGQMETHATVRGDKVADQAIENIDSKQEDFFLYAQFWDPHIPCKRSKNEIEELLTPELPEYLTADQLHKHMKKDWNSPSTINLDSGEDVRKLIAGYDAEINYVDKQIGRIIQKLKKEEIYDETLIILTADHGEEFGEHGIYREHWSVYEVVQRIPLIVKPPNGSEMKKIDKLVTNVDIAPTAAEYASFKTPIKWQGSSLKPLIQSQNIEWRNHLVVDHGLYTAQRAIISEDGWKFTKTLHSGLSDLPEKQLFNLEKDDYEQQNLVEEKNEKAEELEKQMEKWVKKHLILDEDPLKQLAKKGPVGYRYLK